MVLPRRVSVHAAPFGRIRRLGLARQAWFICHAHDKPVQAQRRAGRVFFATESIHRWQAFHNTRLTLRSLGRRRRHGGRHRGARRGCARDRVRNGRRAWRCRHHFGRRLPDRRIAAAERKRHSRHARSRLQGLDRVGRSVGRRGLGALLHRAQPARSLSSGPEASARNGST